MRIATGVWLLAGLLTGTALAGPEVLRVRHWSAPDHTRVVLDLSGPGAYEVRRVGNPERLAVNVRSARFRSTATIPVDDSLVRRIRRNGLRGRAQVVLDLARDVPYRHFTLAAANGRPDRIVIDLFRDREVTGRAEGESPPEPATAALSGAPRAVKPFTVVLDPGHGGVDPGAVRRGVREKDVVLKVAKETARLLNQLPGYRAVLTRERDYFLSLARRVRTAQNAGGDLFLSVHCNSHPRATTAGMEVYFLSLKGATDREAKELADKENAADLVGLAPQEQRDDSVLEILMDLRMTRVLDHSSRLAERILAAAGRSGVVGARRVKQARFQVLSSLAMPSALVELAYLTNSRDRQVLVSRQGVVDLARTLVDGILDYRGDQQATAALVPLASWSWKYTVRRGDSLWKLARKHGTTIAKIREENKLRSTRLMVGQKLRLPEVD